MKKVLICALLFSTPVFAQATTSQELIERTIGNLIIQNANLQSKVIDLQKEIENLKKEKVKNDNTPSKN